jgi:enoyl-CoA hydratase/carnithine racemase
VGLAAVCDVVVAADTMQFCLSEARLGLLPGTVGPYVVRALGERTALRAALLAGTTAMLLYAFAWRREVVFVAIASIVLAPFLHRLLHRLHAEPGRRRPPSQ